MTFYFYEIHRISYRILGAVWCLSYIIGCVLAVYFFISNLSKLAESRSLSLQDIHSPDDVLLDAQQQKLSDLSAKYAMLFVIPILSTILVIVSIGSVNAASGLWNVFWTSDYCVNLWCLYLQFPFAKYHYNRCCGCCDGHCRNYARQRTRSLIHNNSNSKSRELTDASCDDGDNESK